ncbi:MAG: GumC family protein, partial [Glaciecola sp.]
MNNVAYQLYVWLDVAWRRRYVIAIPFLIMPIIGFAVGLVSPKTYTAHTSMLIQETSKLNPFLEDFAVSAMLKERLSALQTLLHSRHVLYKVAVDRGLIDEKSSKVEQDRAIYLLSSSLRMEMSGKDLIRIQYTASDPEVIEPILQTLSGYFIEQLLAPERSSMEDSSEFLMDLLADRKVELERSENALAAFKNKHAEQLPELHMGNVSRLAQLKNRLFEREAELAGALNSLGTIDQQLSKTNPVMAKLEEEIVTLQSNLTLLRARYTDGHSSVQGTLRRLTRLQTERNNALSNIDNQVNADQLITMAGAANSDTNGTQPRLLISQLDRLQSVRNKVSALTEEVKSLRQMIVEQTKQTSQLGELDKQLNILQRDLKVKNKLYEEFLERSELARVTGSLGTFEKENRIKIIDLPFTPSIPSSPSAIVFLLA